MLYRNVMHYDRIDRYFIGSFHDNALFPDDEAWFFYLFG